MLWPRYLEIILTTPFFSGYIQGGEASDEIQFSEAQNLTYHSLNICSLILLEKKESGKRQSRNHTLGMNGTDYSFLISYSFTYMNIASPFISPLINKMTVFFVNSTKLSAKEKEIEAVRSKAPKDHGVLYTLDSIFTGTSVTSIPNSF